MILQLLSKTKRPQQGFTLVEILIAGLVSLITAYVSGDVLINYIETAERAESLERQRENWSRTAAFIEADIALAESIFNLETDTEAVSIPSECSSDMLDSGNALKSGITLKLGLVYSNSHKPVVYFTRDATAGWLGSHALWRCGPTFDNLGKASQTSAETALILDGIDGKDGLKINTVSNNKKQVSFTLSLKGHSLNKTYSQINATQARITPLFVSPTIASYCTGNTFTASSRGTSAQNFLQPSVLDITSGSATLICGEGGGDLIYGHEVLNDILEGGSDSSNTSIQDGAEIYGFGGNDRIRGTDDPASGDLLYGGAGNDDLIGREGNDILSGGTGTNRYLPGNGNDYIYGNSCQYKFGNDGTPVRKSNATIYIKKSGDWVLKTDQSQSNCEEENGSDIVYFPKTKNNYEFSGSCTQESCTITDKATRNASDSDTTQVPVSKDVLKSVEILIFEDARFDVPPAS